VRRNKDKQKPEKTDEVEVIYVTALIEKEEIGVAEEKQNRINPVEKTDRNEQCEQPIRDPMNVEPITRPRLDP